MSILAGKLILNRHVVPVIIIKRLVKAILLLVIILNIYDNFNCSDYSLLHFFLTIFYGFINHSPLKTRELTTVAEMLNNIELMRFLYPLRLRI
jgi:hypothetical protein